MPKLQFAELDRAGHIETTKCLRTLWRDFRRDAAACKWCLPLQAHRRSRPRKNTQGAIPVVLALHQLSVNLSGVGRQCISVPSYNLEPNTGINLPICEIDFLVVIPRTYPHKAEILLGECKDTGGVIDANDVEKLGRVADALPAHRFRVYVVFSKLGSFTPEEITLVKALNRPFQFRVILLTARELEPWHIFERTEKELGIKSYGGSPEELARVTSQMYFSTIG